MRKKKVVFVSLLFLAIVVLYFFTPATTLYFFRVNYLAKKCDYIANSCGANEACVFLQPNFSKCVPLDKDEKAEIIFPLFPTAPTICTQGARSKPGRTHSYLNTAFAIDLASPKSEKNAAIRAVLDGTVFTNIGCENHDDKEFNNDYCGQGFGNWVVVIDDSNMLIAFYAHLKSVLIGNGERVQKGAVIGEEGKTGSAGHRHLHFSLHKNIWNVGVGHFKKNGIWLPPSISYKTKIKANGELQAMIVEALPCVDSNDLNRPPFFGGI